MADRRGGANGRAPATAGALLDDARRTLRADAHRFARVGDEREQALELLEHVLGRRPRPAEPVPARERARFLRLVDRRASGEPIPHIIGWEQFRGLRLPVRPGAFVPRTTTEFLVEQAVRRLHGRRRPAVVDVATGIGPVALAVASEVRHARVFGTDISGRAVARARANARRFGLRNVKFLRSDLLSALPRNLRGRVDVVTCHPPYVSSHEFDDLVDEVRAFEPPEAVLSGGSGIGLVRPLAQESHDWLRSGGWLLIEIGEYRARSVRSLMERAGYRAVRSTIGPLGYTHVVVGRR